MVLDDDRSFSQRFRQWLSQGERLGARVAATLVFVALLGFLLFLAIAANPELLQLLAGVLAVTMLRVILPIERFQDWARSYWTGEAGTRWLKRFERVEDWTRRTLSRLAFWR